MHSILSLLSFTDDQYRAVTTRDVDIAVTAGAGSGKTRALVGRYLSLLEDDLSPRSVIAITFTEKAAREMRTRIRDFIQQWLNDGPDDVDRSKWEEVYAELDAAPIGTIHSLCATILRTHPAEAGIDPAFDVLDEGVSAALRAEAVEAALVWAANDPDAAGLFSLLTENGLRRSVATLLENRLDTEYTFDTTVRDPLAYWQAAIRREIAGFLDHPEVRRAVGDLESLRADGTLARLAGDKLAAKIEEFFVAWDAIASTWEAGDLQTVLTQLPEARSAMRTHLGRKSDWPDIDLPRDALGALRAHYEATLSSLLKYPPDWSLDQELANALPHLRRVVKQAQGAYKHAEDQRRALDFDDLEAGAVELLENHPEVCAYWQSQADAVLVDEFQDTNDRQRRIVYALTGFGRLPSTGKLFVVGDAKQSIYRFRGADVTVFREVQRDVEADGGDIIDLDLTFRAHEPLLDQINALLAPIMGTSEDHRPAYVVPFVPLDAYRSQPADGIAEPYVEFCLGLGETASDGRVAAANALARRLRELHQDEDVDWGDIGLLFRASTGFSDYESALEEAGIPFVTVAGRGFYDRPEVRDLLNALRAIADPTDDRALAGLLRSPAFGLTDGALYLLRRGEDGTKRSLWASLRGDLSLLNDEDRERAQRAYQIVAELNELVGRTTVAQILKQFLDRTNYRAILRFPTDDQDSAVGERARRNVDKLVADAHASRLVSVGEFLEYLQTLRDVAAREGEAPVEAGNAVQLMTVHKAKGLEFPVVVIADAGHSARSWAPAMLLDSSLGPVLKLRGDDNERSIVYRLARLRDLDMEDAEGRRLLYVAATRAEEKLLISGHVKASTAKKHPGKLLPQGWLKQLGEIVGLDQVHVESPLEAPITAELSDIGGRPVGCRISPEMLLDPGTPVAGENNATQGPTDADEVVYPPPLLRPILEMPIEQVDETVQLREAEPPPRVWRIVPTAERPRGPAWVVGTLVHEALRRWWFPDRDGFDTFLELHAREAGLTDDAEIDATVNEARKMLERFRAHPLHTEMEDAERCYHEVPYTIELDGRVKSGKIDVLYQHADCWHVVDFKTDEMRSKDDFPPKDYGKHQQQVRDYVRAVHQLMGAEAQGWLCFLNVAGEIQIERVEGGR